MEGSEGIFQNGIAESAGDLGFMKMRYVRFNYLYRDAGNWKVYGSVVFVVPEGITLEEIEAKIREKLIDGLYFDPDKWGIPRLQHDRWISNLDHTWNEFEGVEWVGGRDS